MYRTIVTHHKMKKIAPSKAITSVLEPFPALSIKQIALPRTPAEFAAANREISNAAYVGFDTESRPVFTAGTASDGPHIVQFALSDRAFIFQLRQPECRKHLIQLLQSENVLKVGFDLKSDHAQILSRLGIRAGAVLDLNHVFSRHGYPKSMGARAAVGAVLNQRFHKSKRITTSNWAMAQLSTSQLLYAANDAYAAFKVYEALKAANTAFLLPQPMPD